MTGAELVEFAREHKRLLAYAPELGGATEVGSCQVCSRPFLYNSLVRVPETCGRDGCSKGTADQDLDWTIPPPAPPKRGRKAKAAPVVIDAPEPVCWCACHANVYLERWGMVPGDIEWESVCEHCTRPT